MLPKFYIIEPTNICNYRCSICPNSLYKKSEQGFIDWDTFIDVIEQIKDVAEVIQLYWMGEPLLHPQICNMISYCKANTSAKTMMSTNASLMTSSVADDLIRSGLDEIIISLDACDSQDIYQKIRTGGNIAAVNKNVSYLINNNSNIHIILQFIDMYINRSERDQFLAKWSDYDCDINVQCLYSWSNQLPELNDASDNLSPMIGKKRTPCADLWNKMCIRWNGDIALCCFDWSTSVRIGSVKEDRLIDIWHGTILENLRKQHSCGLFSGVCAKCDAWATESEYTDLFHLD